MVNGHALVSDACLTFAIGTAGCEAALERWRNVPAIIALRSVARPGLSMSSRTPCPSYRPRGDDCVRYLSDIFGFAATTLSDFFTGVRENAEPAEAVASVRKTPGNQDLSRVGRTVGSGPRQADTLSVMLQLRNMSEIFTLDGELLTN
jgi:hypothetical protein